MANAVTSFRLSMVSASVTITNRIRAITRHGGESAFELGGLPHPEGLDRDPQCRCRSSAWYLRVIAGSEELYKTATREIPGTVSLSSSSRFPLSSVENSVTPVILPPGRAMLATRPVPTGSPAPSRTMGILEVALLAA